MAYNAVQILLSLLVLYQGVTIRYYHELHISVSGMYGYWGIVNMFVGGYGLVFGIVGVAIGITGRLIDDVGRLNIVLLITYLLLGVGSIL